MGSSIGVQCEMGFGTLEAFVGLRGVSGKEKQRYILTTSQVIAPASLGPFDVVKSIYQKVGVPLRSDESAMRSLVEWMAMKDKNKTLIDARERLADLVRTRSEIPGEELKLRERIKQEESLKPKEEQGDLTLLIEAELKRNPVNLGKLVATEQQLMKAEA